MIERRDGQCMECVVLAPFSKWVRSATAIVPYIWVWKRKNKSDHLTADSFQRFPQDEWSSISSSCKANGWRYRERAVFDLFSNLKWVRSSGFFW